MLTRSMLTLGALVGAASLLPAQSVTFLNREEPSVSMGYASAVAVSSDGVYVTSGASVSPANAVVRKFDSHGVGVWSRNKADRLRSPQ